MHKKTKQTLNAIISAAIAFPLVIFIIISQSKSKIEDFSMIKLTENGYSNIQINVISGDTQRGNFSGEITFNATNKKKNKVTGKAKIYKTRWFFGEKILEIVELENTK